VSKHHALASTEPAFDSAMRNLAESLRLPMLTSAAVTPALNRVRRLRMSIYLIVLLCTLSHSGFGGSRIAISLYALDLGATQFTVGVLMALYAICPLLLAVYVGRLADRVGPRIPMLIGTIGVMVGLLVPPLFPGMITLYASALVLGSTFHFFFITVQGIAGGIGGSENRARNFALVGMGFSAAGFVGPLLAGVAIDHLGHRAAFLVLSVFPVVPVLLLWLKPGFLPKARSAPRATRNAARWIYGKTGHCARLSSQVGSFRPPGICFSSISRYTDTLSGSRRRRLAPFWACSHSQRLSSACFYPESESVIPRPRC
jgi:MFS family permease